jgi:hypothetical protein
MMIEEQLKARLDEFNLRAAKLSVRLHKAVQRRMGLRIPGDGDGDGIPNEGKKKGTPMGMAAAHAAYPKHAKKLSALGEGKSITVATDLKAGKFNRLTRHGDNIHVETGVTPRGIAKPADAAATRAAGEALRQEAANHAARDKLGVNSPAKMTNVGTAKNPYNIKTSEKLPGKHQGNTHYVGGFKAPGNGTGDHDVAHNGLHYSFTGKTGTHNASGSKSYEYKNTDGGSDKRLWVNAKGHAQDD